MKIVGTLPTFFRERVNFNYLPLSGESEKISKWGGGMVLGQVFLKVRGSGTHFFKVYHIYI